MKRMNATIVRVRNSVTGEFEGFPALQGISPYELAVENGFEGSEEEWVESMLGNGWIGETQELRNELNTTNEAINDINETIEGLREDISITMRDAMPKSGGTFTGNTVAADTAGNVSAIRNHTFFNKSGTAITDVINVIRCYDKT